MAGTLHFLGIHEGDIEHASDIVEAVCDKHGIHSDCVWSAVLNEFEEAFGWTRVTFVRWIQPTAQLRSTYPTLRTTAAIAAGRRSATIRSASRWAGRRIRGLHPRHGRREKAKNAARRSGRPRTIVRPDDRQPDHICQTGFLAHASRNRAATPRTLERGKAWQVWAWNWRRP